METHPGLVDDCNVRVFTGDDALADEIDDQYLIDINKMFPAEQAEALKAAIGKTSWQAIHVPTIVVRSCDGGTTSRWSAMQLCMTFIDAYNMCAGEAAVADLALRCQARCRSADVRDAARKARTRTQQPRRTVLRIPGRYGPDFQESPQPIQ